MSHELPVKFRPKFAGSSHTCRANVAQQNFEFFALATVARHVCELPAIFGLNFAGSSCDIRANVVQFFCRNLATKCLNYVAICSQFICNFVALPGVPGQFAPVSRPECQILIFVSNQSQFSCIGRQPLTKLSHISRTFWLTETKLRRVRDGFETPATTLWLFWEKICHANFVNMFKIPATRERGPATHARKLRTPCERFETFLKLPRECRSQFVANSRSPVRY